MKIICEKCGKEVEGIKIPAYQGHSTSRISAKSVTKSFPVAERILSLEKHDCIKPVSHKEKLRRLKENGLPTKIEQCV